MRDEWRSRPGAPPPGTALCGDVEIADGDARVVAFGRGWPPFEVIVVRERGRLRGYVNECPHQPLPLNVDALRATGGELLCDHHPARFRFADGLCTAGPCAGSSLVSVPLEVRNGTIVIATS